jgi:hypothetical protein
LSQAVLPFGERRDITADSGAYDVRRFLGNRHNTCGLPKIGACAVSHRTIGKLFRTSNPAYELDNGFRTARELSRNAKSQLRRSTQHQWNFGKKFPVLEILVVSAATYPSGSVFRLIPETEVGFSCYILELTHDPQYSLFFLPREGEGRRGPSEGPLVAKWNS